VIALVALKLECDYYKIKFLHHPQLNPKDITPIVRIVNDFATGKTHRGKYSILPKVFEKLSYISQQTKIFAV
jgi:hypothetical protein